MNFSHGTRAGIKNATAISLSVLTRVVSHAETGVLTKCRRGRPLARLIEAAANLIIAHGHRNPRDSSIQFTPHSAAAHDTTSEAIAGTPTASIP